MAGLARAKSRLFVNPVSGTDLAPDYLPMINERLRARVGLMDIVMTIAEDDAAQAAEQAVRDGYEQLFVAGGDGTLNEVLNGVMAVDGAIARVTLGVIPLGTGNDFATALGFADSVETAVGQLLASEAVAVDLGELNGRAFLNVSGGGFIAEVSDAVDPRLKSIAGKLAYLIGGAQVLLSHEPVGCEIDWTADDARRQRQMPLHAFAVCNSRQVGGGRLIAPDARLDDGLLDICLIADMPTLEFVALLRRVSSGDHVDDERVSYFRASEVTLRFDRTVKVNTDGQVLDADECRYRVHPGAARVMAPRDAAQPPGFRPTAMS